MDDKEPEPEPEPSEDPASVSFATGEIVLLFRYLLGREPRPEEIVALQNSRSLSHLTAVLLASEEVRSKSCLASGSDVAALYHELLGRRPEIGSYALSECGAATTGVSHRICAK